MKKRSSPIFPLVAPLVPSNLLPVRPHFHPVGNTMDEKTNKRLVVGQGDKNKTRPCSADISIKPFSSSATCCEKQMEEEEERK